jgi:hypothetical protein
MQTLPEHDLSNHDFEKLNLVSDKKGYDYLKCKKCGLTATRKHLGYLTIKSSFSENKIKFCAGVNADEYLGKKIKINKKPQVNNKAFYLLEAGQEHETIEPPETDAHLVNDATSCWIQGDGEPIRLLLPEFEYIS